MKKCIIFDVYGTLISTGTGSVDATQKIFEKYKLKHSAQEIYAHWKKIHKWHIAHLDKFCPEKTIFIKDLELLFEHYGITDNAKTAIQPMIDSLFSRQPFSETEYVLNTLKPKYKIILGSTTDTLPLLENLKNVQFQFDAIYTSEMLQCYKPDSAFYESILKKEGITASESFFVGDSLDDDAIGPSCVGITSFLLDRKGKYAPDIRQHNAFRVIHNLTELLNIL